MLSKNTLKIIEHIPLVNIKRIDVALEGNWNSTVTTVWTKDKGFMGLSNVIQTHIKYIPSLELYFEDSWIGIHCYTRINDINVFDKELALEIIEYVENQISV